LLALDAVEPCPPEAILAVEVDPVLSLATAAVELGARVLPDGTEESQSELLEVIIPLWEAGSPFGARRSRESPG